MLQTLFLSHDVIFRPDWQWPAAANFNVILYTSRLPEFVQEELYCESGWSVSAWKVPPELSLSLDNNWFRREIGLNNLDPLLHEIYCCLIRWSWEIKLWSFNYDLFGKQKSGLIWYETIVIIKWIHLFASYVFSLWCQDVVLKNFLAKRRLQLNGISFFSNSLTFVTKL